MVLDPRGGHCASGGPDPAAETIASKPIGRGRRSVTVSHGSPGSRPSRPAGSCARPAPGPGTERSRRGSAWRLVGAVRDRGALTSGFWPCLPGEMTLAGSRKVGNVLEPRTPASPSRYRSPSSGRWRGSAWKMSTDRVGCPRFAWRPSAARLALARSRRPLAASLARTTRWLLAGRSDRQAGPSRPP